MRRVAEYLLEQSKSKETREILIKYSKFKVKNKTSEINIKASKWLIRSLLEFGDVESARQAAIVEIF